MIRFFVVVICCWLIAGCDGRSNFASKDPSASAAAEQYTNLQEKGIDEPDYVKLSDKQIFVVTNRGIEVIARSSLSYVGRLEIEDSQDQKLFVYRDYLLVVQASEVRYGIVANPKKTTRIRVYRTHEYSIPALIADREWSGNLFEARVNQGKFVGVLFDPISDVGALRESIDLTDESVCRGLIKPFVMDGDIRLTKVVVMDLDEMTAEPSSVAILGGGDQIYMGPKSLYVIKNGYDDRWSYSSAFSSPSIISKFDVSGGKPEVVAIGAIWGRAKDSWAFKEFADSGVLMAATTTGQLWAEGDDRAQNHLWALQQDGKKLTVVNAIHNYGSGEDIRAIRYVNNTAYVVTFKKTDPLYAFDVSDPASPKLLGELKVPGFSTYLHPVGSDRLIGVGFDALDQDTFALFQGVQVSFFNVANPMQMARLDSHVLGARGSYSDITGDHHAFFYDEQSRLLGVPIVELSESSGWKSGSVDFSGARLYSVERNSLREAAKLSHRNKLPGVCLSQLQQWRWWQDKVRSLDINRLYSIDGKVIAISQFGASAHEPYGGAMTADLSFPGATCGAIY